MRILVGHPGRQHSFRLAVAVKQAGMLERYATTVYQGERSITRLITPLLRGLPRERVEKRRIVGFSRSDILQYGELGELLRMIAAVFDPYGALSKLLMRATSHYFQLRVARYAIKHAVDAVIMYDTNASTCFKILKRRAPNILRLMDHAHPGRGALHHVYQGLLPTCGPFVGTLTERFIFDKEAANRASQEIALGHYHIVASSFSKRCAVASGAVAERVAIVPYGVDLETFRPHAKQPSSHLRCLFVGEVSQRKGIYQILEAAKMLHDDGVLFTVIGGGADTSSDLYDPYRDVVDFRGRVSFEDLVDAYRSSDLFIFPAMGEGFGQVLLEAMASGLPAICTPNCAGPDLITNWKNGVIIPPGQIEPLVSAVRRLKADPTLLAAMSKEAIAAASRYTWEAYNQSIRRLLESIEQQNDEMDK